MQADGEGLLAAIVAEPDKRDLRLIYADWLEDAGHADRAAMVRGNKVKLSKKLRWQTVFPEFVDVVNYCHFKLVVDGQQINDYHKGRERYGLTFVHGFLISVRVPMGTWLDHGKEWCKTNLIVEAWVPYNFYNNGIDVIHEPCLAKNWYQKIGPSIWPEVCELMLPRQPEIVHGLHRRDLNLPQGFNGVPNAPGIVSQALLNWAKKKEWQ